MALAITETSRTPETASWIVRCGYIWTRSTSLAWTHMWCTLTSHGLIHFGNQPQDMPPSHSVPGLTVMDACLLPGHVPNGCSSQPPLPSQPQPFRVRLAAPAAASRPNPTTLCSASASGTPLDVLLCTDTRAGPRAAEQWVQAINDTALSNQKANQIANTSSANATALHTAGLLWSLPQQAAGLTERYHIDHNVVLGSGLFASVYQATELSTGKKRAVKVLKPGVVQEHPGLITRELSAWSAVGSHPHVCQLLDSWCLHTQVYMVSDLCGDNLLRYLASHRSYSERDASRIMRQVLEALHHIHAAGVVHCDVKPENICMATRAPDSPIKLIDFSLACFAFTPMTPGGTPEFIAPELLQRPAHYAAHGCGPAVDLWSAGVLLFYLLSRQTPFYAPSQEGILDRVRSGSWDFSTAAWHSVTNPAKDLVRKLLQVNPDARPSAWDAMRHPWFQVASVHPACMQPLQAPHTALQRRQQPQLPATPAPAGEGMPATMQMAAVSHFTVGLTPAPLNNSQRAAGVDQSTPLLSGTTMSTVQASPSSPAGGVTTSCSAPCAVVDALPSATAARSEQCEPAECLLAAVQACPEGGVAGAGAWRAEGSAEGAPYRRRRSQTFSAPGPVPHGVRLAGFGSLPRDTSTVAVQQVRQQAQGHLEEIRALLQQVADLRALLSSRASCDCKPRHARAAEHAPTGGDADHLRRPSSRESAWHAQGQQQLITGMEQEPEQQSESGQDASLAVDRVSAARSSPSLSSVGTTGEIMSGLLSRQVTRLTEPGDECSPRRCLSMPSVQGGPLRHNNVGARLVYLQRQLLQVLSRQATLQSEGEADTCSLSDRDRGSSRACSLVDDSVHSLLTVMNASLGAGSLSQRGEQLEQQMQPVVACQAATALPEPTTTGTRGSSSSQHPCAAVRQGDGPVACSSQTSYGAAEGNPHQAFQERAARLRQLQVLEQQLKTIAQRRHPGLKGFSPL